MPFDGADWGSGPPSSSDAGVPASALSGLMTASAGLAQRLEELERQIALRNEIIMKRAQSSGSKSVRQFLARPESRMFREPLRPDWASGGPSDVCEQPFYPIPNWWPEGSENIEAWKEEDFIAFLNGADDVEFDGVRVLSLILDLTKNDGLGDILETALLGETSYPDNVTYEDSLWMVLSSSVWNSLCWLMGRGFRFPVDEVLDTRDVYTHEIDASVPVQYRHIFEPGHAIEARPRSLASRHKPNQLPFNELRSTSSRFVVQLRPDWSCPRPKSKNDENMNRVCSSGLLNYMMSKYFDSDFDPVSLAATRALMARCRYFLIYTGNVATFGQLDVKDGELVVRLTPTYKWAVAEKRLNNWSPWEVLVRFVLAPKGAWHLEAYPDSLKRLFKNNNNNKGQPVDRPKKRGRFALSRLYWEDLWAPQRFAVPATHSFEEECTEERLPGDAEVLARGRMGPTYRKTLQGRDAVIKTLPYSRPRDNLDGRSNVDPYYLREEMEQEKTVYDRLAALQGTFIPRLLWYGEIVEDMVDALVTEYAGTALSKLERTEALIHGATRALEALHAAGVLHGDVALRNFVVLDGQVKLIDFGMAKFREEFERDSGSRSEEDSDESDDQEVDWDTAVQKERELLVEIF